MEEEIKAAARRWAEALATMDPDQIIRMYHPDGSLWGTFAGRIHHTPEVIRDYFTELCHGKENLRCDFLDGFIRLYGEFAFYSGSYRFSWRVTGEPCHRDARFSFVYIKESGEWMIMEHHSSAFPG